MSYSVDIRRLVVSYVEGGGSKSEAARIYGVSRGRVYEWLRLGKNLNTGRKPGPRSPRKLSVEALTQAIAARPDVLLKEMAKQFGVHESTISRNLKRLDLRRKKNVPIFSGDMQER